jgi:hypothetical protein
VRTCVLASRKLERVETAAAEIRAAGARRAAIAVDVREPERVQAHDRRACSASMDASICS